LSVLHQKNIFHRNIRPDNLFWSSRETTTLVLGEFLSLPPAFAQPSFVETIESMMCHPLGRGPGSERDDLYALGATLISLYFGRPLMANVPLEDQIHKKIDHGSYDALTHGLPPIPNSFSPFLKGVL